MARGNLLNEYVRSMFLKNFLRTSLNSLSLYLQPLLREDNGLMIFCLVCRLSGAHWLTRYHHCSGEALENVAP